MFHRKIKKEPTDHKCDQLAPIAPPYTRLCMGFIFDCFLDLHDDNAVPASPYLGVIATPEYGLYYLSNLGVQFNLQLYRL